MNKSIFRAYDIRGKYPDEINEQAVYEISSGLSRFFKMGKVVVAHDARLSSPCLYREVLKGFSVNKGIKLIKVGFATTPMFYFLVGKLKAKGGVVVTASHNPKEWNGLKVVGKGAKMISGKEVLKILQKPGYE